MKCGVRTDLIGFEVIGKADHPAHGHFFVITHPCGAIKRMRRIRLLHCTGLCCHGELRKEQHADEGAGQPCKYAFGKKPSHLQIRSPGMHMVQITVISATRFLIAFISIRKACFNNAGSFPGIYRYAALPIERKHIVGLRIGAFHPRRSNRHA